MSHVDISSPRRFAWAPPWVVATAAILGGLLLMFGLIYGGFRLANPGVLPGTIVANPDALELDETDTDAELLEVGDLPRAELEEAVAAYAERRATDEVEVRVTDSDDRVSTTAEEVGLRLDVEATVEDVWRRGRQANLIRAFGDHVRSLYGQTVIAPTDRVDPAAATEWSESVADELRIEVVDGEVTFDGATVDVTEPREGREIDPEGLLADGARLARLGGDQVLEADPETVEPDPGPEETSELAEAAERAVSGPVHLTRDEGAVTFSREQLGELFAAGDDIDPPEDSVFGIDPEDLDEAVDDEERTSVETDPVDADIVVADGQPQVEESQDGFAFDAERAAEQVAELAVAEEGSEDDPRTAELEVEVVEPDRTTADAEDLQVTEAVSSFTTEHACCQGRVQNIQRMADIVNGTLVEPGEEFSINDHVGPRTREAGFTDGGIIIAGEFEEAVGGGTSQFATTFMNAAWYGGYELLEHQPHSYYIGRYPAGHEATLNYGVLDVRLRNDSPHGLYITTSYTGTSITVTFWGSEWVAVESWTSGRTNVTQPDVEYEENPGLTPGTEEIVQSGREGFNISYHRRLDYHDGGDDEESYNHRYRPEPRIIERNSADPEPDEPDGGDDDGGDDDGGDDEGDDEGDDDGGDNGDGDDGANPEGDGED
ncbi:hypothetical protein ER308_18980 [Egibacter rhizosphaerae]|uniref:YoaR-like putative peptidoglycan binding domain-containing protein n=1 Tax=Egibacter rhizosphaerae TaxID=1670831 RepID=A0A411YJS2_9ACTN|nr:VanW family protein [Egibacter rhizosphaerae]QBI21446.1 hypothetical protein ER308_18980 [Egibacter rhizosphaerae]